MQGGSISSNCCVYFLKKHAAQVSLPFCSLELDGEIKIEKMNNPAKFWCMLGAFILLGSCSSDGDHSARETGKVVVRLTDAPFPFSMVAEANVTIFKLDARMLAEDGGEETSNEGMDGAPSYQVLMEEEMPLNILQLSNGITTVLAETDLPAGSYDLVRVYVKGINIVLTDGTTYDLKVPSGAESGIKVFVMPHLLVTGGLTSDLLLDFDVSRSFVPKGNASSLDGILGFNCKPVIKGINNTFAGTLAGNVAAIQEDDSRLGLEGAEVDVYAADTLNTTTFTDADGNYMVMGLLEGTYDVDVTLDGYEPAFAEDVDIVAGNKTQLGFDLTPLPEEPNTGG